MSILLGIIALSLFSIAGTLKNNGRLEVNKNLCGKWYAMVYTKLGVAQSEIDAFYLSMAKKIGIHQNVVSEYCSRIKSYLLLKIAIKYRCFLPTFV